MSEIAESDDVELPSPADDDLPVEAMRYSLAQHYEGESDVVPIEDERQFDVDLKQIFVRGEDAPSAEPAYAFLRRHYREIVTRVSFWTSEHPSVVRSLLDVLQRRAEARDDGERLRFTERLLRGSEPLELRALAGRVVGTERGDGGARGGVAHPGNPFTMVSATARSRPTPSR